MRRTIGSVLALLVVAGACSGSSSEAVPDPTPVPDEPAGVEESTPTPPGELPLASGDISITGDTGALVVPGETVQIDHLVRNGATGSRSIGFRVASEDDSLDVDLSTGSIRLAADEILILSSELTIADDAQVGDVFEYSVVVVNVDDISERASTTVQLLVVDATGSRPQAAPDAGATLTNERVLVYVFGDDVDDDDDLDLSTLRVIAGGFLADEITGAGDGTITYVPFANVTGRDVVLYEICDGEDRCDTTTVTIDIGD